MNISLKENINTLKTKTSGSADFTVRELRLRNGESVAIITTEGMSDKESLAISVVNPMLGCDPKKKRGEELFDYLVENVLSAGEVIPVDTLVDALRFSMSGFAVLMVDQSLRMLAIGVQGYSHRSVSEPESELVQRGSREGFTEASRINMTLIRRRMKTPDLVFETMTVGSVSKTELVLVYLEKKATKSSVDEVRKRLKACDIKTVLGSGYLVPYLEDSGKNEVFTGVGITERPDTLCGKLTEGRIGIIVDGTPSVLVIPHLFVENFQSVDDYSNRPYFAAIIRILKYISYFAAVLFPGIYIALVNFHPDYFPKELLKNIRESIDHTPLPLILVSIVGALVIGDCAINAGIIGAPTLMSVAIAAICSYVIPDLYPQVTVLRLSFIVVGGMLGIFGVASLSAVVLVFMCSKSTLGVVYMSPLTPFSQRHMRDVFVRLGWKKLSKYEMNVQNLKGYEK